MQKRALVKLRPWLNVSVFTERTFAEPPSESRGTKTFSESLVRLLQTHIVLHTCEVTKELQLNKTKKK